MKAVREMKSENAREALAEIKAAVLGIAGDKAKMFLYGSYARGEETPESDLDVMVVIPDDIYSISMKDKILDAVIDIGLDREILISPLVVSRSIAERFKGFKVFASVEKEGITL